MTTEKTDMSEPTPGPWAISGDYGLLSSEIVARDGRRAIASVWTKRAGVRDEYDSWPEGEANARLISSAPDLLAACEAVLDWLEHGRLVGTSSRSLVDQLEAAIYNAGGFDAKGD